MHKLPVRAQDQNGSQLMLMPLTGYRYAAALPNSCCKRKLQHRASRRKKTRKFAS